MGVIIEKNEKFKELNKIQDDEVNIIKIDNYYDVFNSNLENNSDIASIGNIYSELLNVSSAYWNNNSDNKTVSRIME